MGYRLAADFLFTLHLLFICFVVAGAALGWKWRWILFLHFPAAVWGAMISFFGWPCPLTPLEKQLREVAGQHAYPGGFIEYYLVPVIYPDGLTPQIQIGMGLFVVVFNLLIYAGIFWAASGHTGRPDSGVQDD